MSRTKKLPCMKITSTRFVVHTVFSLSIFSLENPFYFVILLLLARNGRSARYKKSVAWTDHSNVNIPVHTFHFSHVFVLRTHFTDFSQVVLLCTFLIFGHRHPKFIYFYFSPFWKAAFHNFFHIFGSILYIHIFYFQSGIQNFILFVPSLKVYFLSFLTFFPLSICIPSKGVVVSKFYCPFLFKLINPPPPGLRLCIGNGRPVRLFVLVRLTRAQKYDQFHWPTWTLSCVLVGGVETYVSACIYTRYMHQCYYKE